jgi:maltoporin
MRRDDGADYKWDNNVAIAKADLANMASVNILDARYQFGLWDGANLEARGTFFIPKRDTHEGVKKFQSAVDEYKGGQAYYLALGQGLSNGWNKTVLKYAHGSIANYGAFGNDQWLDRSGASNKAYRWSIYNFGDLKLTDRFGVFHVVYGTVSGGFDNNYDHLNNEGKHDYNKKNDKAFQIVVRPYYQLTKMTRLYAEAGFYVESTKSINVDEDNNCWGDTATRTAQGQKYTVAYAITPDASNFWSRPEIRIYASYVHGNANGQDFSTYGSTGGEITFKDGTTKSYSGSNTHDFLFGVMAEAWW